MNPQVGKMSPFIVMEVLERAKELQMQGIDVIHMEVGEPDFDVPQCVCNAAVEALQTSQTHYTHSLGDAELRQTIADFYKSEYGVSVNPDCIVVTSGSSPAILLALMVLCEAGGEVILSNPGYACYRNFVLACNGIPVEVDLRAENGFQFDVDAVRRAVTPRTR
ncbi:MAG: aminotransferase class I/II-fold pyridoxal phosphate-dependent enzyme, partial [Salinivirgaceae bacterium]|nr:aminotransferase class I/II-fold pyridoxal phosphate-dependent enzyme [Salinivirgaceae bacterium]